MVPRQKAIEGKERFIQIYRLQGAHHYGKSDRNSSRNLKQELWRNTPW